MHSQIHVKGELHGQRARRASGEGAPRAVAPELRTWQNRAFLLVAFPVAVGVLLFTATLPATWKQQAVIGAILTIAAWGVNRVWRSRAANILLALLSLGATARYIFWRSNVLFTYLHSPWNRTSMVSAVLMTMLLAAEFYSALILLLGYLQTVAPLRRPIVPMDSDDSTWPTVDVLIPTYNEPLDVVRYAVLAAQAIEWPAHKIMVSILDDGERDEFQNFAVSVGVNYIARTEHSGAKAGNINNALEQTTGEYVIIFDCDHIPTAAFAKSTIGWFLRDAELGLLQTPHHFYSPDPFERNLQQFRKIPNEGNLFYGIVQDANDLWNATFFCGSCAVLRRTALEEVGGIAQETVTEDAHTSLRLQRRGWNTAYINVPMAAGLATETLSAHVSQRIRWARGMAQILRTDNPLLGRGLKLSQRLCYFNATLHYCYAIPRLLFLTAPLLFLLFGISNVPGYWAAILAFAIPHLLLSNIANARIQGTHRHSFWNEIYETVLTPYILMPVLVALISPRHGKFNVTAKGGLQEDDHFDHKIAWPFLALAGLNVLGLCMAIPRSLLDPGHSGTIIINVIWTVFNLVLLGASLAVCSESKQRRVAHRVSFNTPVRLMVGDSSVEGKLVDLSTEGVAVQVRGQWKPNTPVHIEFPREAEGVMLNAAVVKHQGKTVRFQFTDNSIEGQRKVTRVLYSTETRWTEWYNVHVKDRPLRSLGYIVAISVLGYGRILKLSAKSKTDAQGARSTVNDTAIATLLLLAVALVPLRANAAERASHALAAIPPPAIQQTVGIELADKSGVLLSQPGSSTVVRFSIPDTWLMRAGMLHLKYTISVKGAKASDELAEVRLNDAVLGSLTPTAAERAAGRAEVDLPLPAEMLVRRNTLTIQLAGNANAVCAPSGQTATPIRIEPTSNLSLSADPLHVVDDLSALPHPFLEHLASGAAVVPVVFGHQPTQATMKAAGILASWFGLKDEEGRVHFPVSIAALPKGNAVLLVSGDDAVQGISVSHGAAASVSVMENPVDPTGKVLVIYGRSEGDLLSATQAMVLPGATLIGTQASIRSVALPQVRTANDAPRWIRDNRVPLYDLLAPQDRHTNGQAPMNVYMHLAPDYDFGAQQQMYVHLTYQTSGAELAPSSNISVTMNGAEVASYPLAASDRAAAVDIPLVDIPAATFANTLQTHFYFVQPGAACGASDNRASAEILGSSYLDLGNAVHYTRLPNLNLFAKAGFPFTRFADLGQTAVLMPSQPATETISAYLDMMAYFGNSTGYPVTRVEVGSISKSEAFAGKDLLVLGSYGDLASSNALLNAAPVQPANDTVTVGLWQRLGLVKQGWDTEGVSGVMSVLRTGSLPAQAMIAGYESPFSSGRSVVAVMARRDVDMPALSANMMQEMPGDAISESVTLWDGNSFRSYSVLTSNYSLTTLPLFQKIRYALPQMPLMFCGLLLLLGIAGAIWAHGWILERIRIRLRGSVANGPVDEMQPTIS
jgi:cellulose synthase (UDP-forming)